MLGFFHEKERNIEILHQMFYIYRVNIEFCATDYKRRLDASSAAFTMKNSSTVTMSSKTIEQLAENARLYWPSELNEMAAEISSLPILIETQDVFISILKTSDKSPEAWKNTLLQSSTLSPSLFLKHLMVLTDIGGERLQRIAKDFTIIFPENKMHYIWNSKEYTYLFSSEKKSWTNSALNVEKSVLLKSNELTSNMQDVIMLLFWGANIVKNDNIPEELQEKCVIGNLLGHPGEIDSFVKQRYIYVSRITGGSTANDLGHACEKYVTNYLKEKLPNYLSLEGHNIPMVSHNDKNLTTFDIVVKSKKGIYFAIEISFQVTTNSVIERKAGLAQSRKEILNNLGHKVIYIIDGSGNFQRRNAITTLLNFSDLCVNFSQTGLDELISYMNMEGK